jgi:hypothetical protein
MGMATRSHVTHSQWKAAAQPPVKWVNRPQRYRIAGNVGHGAKLRRLGEMVKSMWALLGMTLLAVTACSSLRYTHVDTAPPCPAPPGQIPSLDCRNGGSH